MKDHSNGWNDKMRTEEPAAAERWAPGMNYQPHNGQDSDANLHYGDLFAGPNMNVPDIMEGYVAPAEGDVR